MYYNAVCVQYMYIYMYYTCTCVNVHRLKLESHKQSLAVMEPENRKFKQECKHLQKVKHAQVHFCMYMYTCTGT